MASISFPTEIYMDEAAYERLAELKHEQIFVVTDALMAKMESFQSFIAKIEKDNTLTIFTEVVPDPPIENISKGIQVMGVAQPTMIMAFGGGSPIDAAKGMKYFGMKSGMISEIPFVAIPTTSGTGSEVTNFAVITDSQKGQKYPLVTAEIQPNEALLITDYVMSVPPKVTADTGMDVLTHAIESYVSTKSNPMTEALAEKVVKMVFDNLKGVYKNGGNRELRSNMHAASCMAGLAFNNTSLGINHGIAHTLGAKYHIAHGRLNAALLPVVIAYNAGVGEFSSLYSVETATKYANLASLTLQEEFSPRAGTMALIKEIKKLNNQLNIDEHLSEVALTTEQLLQDIDGLVNGALADGCTATNPRQPAPEEIKQVIKQLFNR